MTIWTYETQINERMEKSTYGNDSESALFTMYY
jgi:hypothetical protein